MSIKNIFIYLILFFIAGCGSEETNQNNVSKDLTLPAVNGGIGEMLLVMDTSHLKLELGEALKNVFLEPFPGLPQAELPFSLTRINYRAFTNLFKRHKTILFAVPFNDGESRGYMNRVLGNDVVKQIIKSERKIYVKEDVFASGQQIIFLFAKTQKEMAEVLNENKEAIVNIIDKRENERLMKMVYGAGEKKKMSQSLYEKFNYKIRIPKDYRLVKDREDITWLRLAKEETDYNILISKRNYTSETQFDSSYVANWRMEVNKNVNGADTAVNKVIQDVFPVERKILSNPEYLLESRGLWKLEDNTMGGPFVSHIRVSEDRKSIYYIEGFIVAPGKKKRELMREIETLMSTFQG